MERIMDIVQSILTYICTGGLACLVGFLIRETKRITVLEEHDKEHLKTAEKKHCASAVTGTAQK